MQPFLAGVGPTRGLIFFGGVKISGLITLQVGLQLGHG
jgi:hypothetical protein